MTETSTTEKRESSGQEFYVGTQQLLSGLAIIVFAVYFWSRSLHWSDYVIKAKNPLPGAVSQAAHTTAMAGTDWGRMDNTIWICAAVVLGINLIYIAFSRATDQLVPAIANTAIGGVLTIVTGYFITSTDAAIGNATETKNLLFTNEAASGARVSLAIAIVLLLIGIVQMVVRAKAQDATAAARDD